MRIWTAVVRVGMPGHDSRRLAEVLAMRQEFDKSGRSINFVPGKKQAKDSIISVTVKIGIP